MTCGSTARLAALLLAAFACGGDEPARPRREVAPLPRPACVIGALAVRDVAEVARVVSSLAGPLLPEAARADARLWAAALADLPSGFAGVLAARGDAHVLLVEGPEIGVVWALPLERGKEPPSFATEDGRKARRAGRHLIVAPDEEILREVAPWVERTLAREPREHAVRWVVDAAKASRASDLLLEGVGALAEELRAQAREMRVQMGRAPEIGEPEGVAGWAEDLGRRVAVAIGDAGVEATVDFSERALSARVVLEVRQGSGLARSLSAEVPGGLDLLAQLPADAVLAVAVRRGVAERREASARTALVLERLAGSRLIPGESAAVGAALRAWDDATGEEGAVAVGGDPPTVLIQSLAPRPEEAAAAGRALAERLGQGHLAVAGQRLGLWSGAPVPEIAVLEGRVALALGPEARARLEDAGHRTWAARPEVVALLAEERSSLVAAGGIAPTAALRLVAHAFGERFARLAASAQRGASSEHAVWALRADGRRLRLDVRVPPPELRAIAAALAQD